jgi:AbrB family looped-hinge helix DNA binding protein
MTIHVGAKNQVTLPKDIVKKARLAPGDSLEVVYENDSIILRPQVEVPRDQAYFWTKDWQEGEKAASADIRAGRLRRFDSAEALARDLKRKRER